MDQKKSACSKTSSSSISVIGLLGDAGLQRAKLYAEDLHRNQPVKVNEPEVVALVEVEWKKYLSDKIKELRGDAWTFNDNVMVFLDGNFIGNDQSLLDWATTSMSYEDFRSPVLQDTLRDETYNLTLKNTKHEFVFMDVEIDQNIVGRLVIELFTDLVPKTCANFKQLCEGGVSSLRYKNSIFHRVVPNGWIQGGDIVGGRGNGGESVYGDVFEDESFALKHTKRGIVGMTNKGRHTNASQFYITLQPAAWLDCKYVAFGQVIEGFDVLQTIEHQETVNERPAKTCKITDCGVVNYDF